MERRRECALRRGEAMRFSIVFDDNGTVLAASVDDQETGKPMPAAGVNRGYFDVSDDLPDVELNHTVEQMLASLDARKLKRSRGQEEADDSEFDQTARIKPTFD
jgi:hypothetical protein